MRLFRLAAAAIVSLWLAAGPLRAEIVLEEFRSAPRTPMGGLTLHGSQLYGVTLLGGDQGFGTLYRFDPATASIEIVAAFDAFNVGAPAGAPLSDGGLLYGLCQASASGTAAVFRIDPGTGWDGTAFSSLEFPAGDLEPSSMIRFGSFLYGLQQEGGTAGAGTIFRIDPATGASTTLASFPGGAQDGEPVGSLVVAGGFLFGATRGVSGEGTIFKFDTTTNSIINVITFNGANGSRPDGGLTVAGSLLYGTTREGGAHDGGTIFKLNPANGALTTLHSFDTPTGSAPAAALYLHNGLLYGTTGSGGSNGSGTLFEFNPDTELVTTVTSFTGGLFSAAPDAAFPDSPLVGFGGNLYGTTLSGGSTGFGTIFRYNPVTHILSTILSFNPDGDPALPKLSLAQGTRLFGVAQQGLGRWGGVFRHDLETGATAVAPFDFGTIGAFEGTALVASGGMLYGATESGGSGCGVIFRLDPDAMTFAKVANMPGCEGGDFIASGGYLYGTTRNAGTSNAGSIFRVDLSTNVVTTLASFPAAAGRSPLGGLITHGAFFYGTTAEGGTGGVGTVYRFDPSTNSITDLASFNCTTTGGRPEAPMVSDGTFLYGTTSPACGPDDGGSVFRFDPATASILSIVNFDGSPDVAGLEPEALLVSGNHVYGTTALGGTHERGTFFRIDRASHILTTLFSFDGDNGAIPLGGLVQVNGNILGATSFGGSEGGGVIYSTNSPPAFAAATALHRTAGSAAGAGTLGSVNDGEEGAGALTVTANPPGDITVTGIANTAGTISATVGVACSATTALRTVPIEVRDNGFGVSASTFTVNVTANPLPVQGTYNNVTINAGGSANVDPSLSPSDNGTFSLTVTPSGTFSGSATVNQNTGRVSLSNVNAGTHTIVITATDNCGATSSKSFTLTAVDPFGAPSVFSASAVSPSAIVLTWSPVGSATQYQVWRHTHPAAPYAIVATTSFTDTAVLPNASYVYRIRAVAGSFVSSFTPLDAASTFAFTDDPLVQNIIAKAVHVNEARAAVNALRAVAGLPPATFDDQPLAAGMKIRAIHITQLRTALDQARAAIGLPPRAYTDPSLAAGRVLKAADVRDIRDGVQ